MTASYHYSLTVRVLFGYGPAAGAVALLISAMHGPIWVQILAWIGAVLLFLFALNAWFTVFELEPDTLTRKSPLRKTLVVDLTEPYTFEHVPGDLRTFELIQGDVALVIDAHLEEFEELELMLKERLRALSSTIDVS